MPDRTLRIQGAWVAMATPFRPDGSIHRETLRRMIDFVIDRGVDGIFAASTTGEYVHLTPPERYELVRLAVEYAAGRVPVAAGAGDVATARVIEHCRELARAGAAAAVIAPPFYYPVGQEELAAHYERIAGSIDLPFVLYHIPQFSAPMKPETILRIVERCRPIALKNSSTNVVEMMTLLAGLRGGAVTYLVGPDELIFTSLELGAAGTMSGLTGIVPEAIRALIDAHRAGRIDAARRIQFEALALLGTIADIPFPYWIKVMLEARGFEMGPPLQALSESTRRVVEERRPEMARRIEELIARLPGLAEERGRLSRP